MITPKQEAEELVARFENLQPPKLSDYSVIYTPTAKQCALIVVDKIIPIVEGYEEALGVDQQSDYAEYWKSVKQEIQNL